MTRRTQRRRKNGEGEAWEGSSWPRKSTESTKGEQTRRGGAAERFCIFLVFDHRRSDRHRTEIKSKRKIRIRNWITSKSRRKRRMARSFFCSYSHSLILLFILILLLCREASRWKRCARLRNYLRPRSVILHHTDNYLRSGVGPGGLSTPVGPLPIMALTTDAGMKSALPLRRSTLPPSSAWFAGGSHSRGDSGREAVVSPLAYIDVRAIARHRQLGRYFRWRCALGFLV